MQYLFEYSDRLSSPYEAFQVDSTIEYFPVRPHWHYFTEIMYMLEGVAMVECDDKTYAVEPEQLIIFHPKAIHSIYAVNTDPDRKSVV